MPALRFCAECNNLLYPKSDPNSKVLYYQCRTCAYEESAEASGGRDSHCVYKNDLLTKEREQPGETKDLNTDPTLQRSDGIPCPNCASREAVFYQDQARRITTNMTLFYYCTNCGQLFRDPKLKTR